MLTNNKLLLRDYPILTINQPFGNRYFLMIYVFVRGEIFSLSLQDQMIKGRRIKCRNVIQIGNPVDTPLFHQINDTSIVVIMLVLQCPDIN